MTDKTFTAIWIRFPTLKRVNIRKAQVGKKSDEFINYLLDCEKELLRLKK
jgi:hypothetical protein